MFPCTAIDSYNEQDPTDPTDPTGADAMYHMPLEEYLQYSVNLLGVVAGESNPPPGNDFLDIKSLLLGCCLYHNDILVWL